MLDKRRLHAPGSPPCTLLFVAALTITGCLSFWLLNGCPGPPLLVSSPMVAQSPAYVLILPGNGSVHPRPYVLSELPPDDETTLIDVRNFRFVINHEPCNKTQPLLLMLIHSAPSNIPKRMVIRETWGQRRNGAIVLFLIGTDDKLQNQIEEEDKIYGDIVQGNFKDAYRNMTYKHVMALKWATYHCPGAKYVLKLDDDVFVHTPAMLEFLSHDLSPWGARRLILCDLMAMAMVKRSWRSKWRVSPLEYPGKTYPVYCAGWAIIYSPDSVFSLYREAQKESYFWIDDVHITGTLAKKVNLTQTPLNSLILKKERLKAVLEKQNSPGDFLFGPANMAESDIRALWYIVTSKPWPSFN
ncbi:beta-1,3-galactosyltransferase 1 [Athalia rosae]|uniref:beta-1,3-galactosyltransferase 1 n=1 Tax=Athalia rosae TaxID=37344 RepID=UPI0006265162|nr:beta-1,3-galactosyltransferase 1 [Athalia rosae]XP_012269101.1 beta-1,3-galactosyltransferase 1 [Athalia rosae]